jgi:hypothetical protein
MNRDLTERIKKLEKQGDTDAELYKRYKDGYKPPLYSKGSYPYFISYRLPGKNIITYTEKHALTVEY